MVGVNTPPEFTGGERGGGEGGLVSVCARELPGVCVCVCRVCLGGVYICPRSSSFLNSFVVLLSVGTTSFACGWVWRGHLGGQHGGWVRMASLVGAAVSRSD